METKTIVGPIKIVGNKDNKASEILKNAFYDALAKIKLNMPFKADGFKAEKTPNQPNGTKIEVEPANIKQPKLERTEEKIEISKVTKIKKTKKKK